MNSGTPTAPEPRNANFPAARLFYWSVRRELWENRSLYIAPLAVAGLILVASLISGFHMPGKMHDSALDPARQRELVEQPYTFAALLLMFTTFVVGIYYSVEALQGERRDRSILFWKSLPVSDLTTVLAKASIPFVVLPLVTFTITVLTQCMMLLLAGFRTMVSGHGEAFSIHVPLFQMSMMLLYHLLAVHSLWWAPLWGWLLLVSAWARRAAFLWATLPLLAIGMLEKIAFMTSYFARMIENRFMGSPHGATFGGDPMSLDALTPNAAQLLNNPGFWLGLAVAGVFIAAAVRLRRYRGPV